ncbi:MAG: chemotaxis protein CheA [Sedimenticola sp.]
MSLDLNDEILQDFLVEAGEILDQLNSQLVELEQNPEDYELLNAVFRGFHTIKGGAGFLSFDALVDVCHRSEDVFNVLRQGQRRVDASLMDVILQALDVVNDMFEQIRSGKEPLPTEQSLLQRLDRFSVPAQEEDAAGEPEGSENAPATEPGPETETETEAEPEAEPEQPAPAVSGGGDDITEDEFEALLDQLHGKGKHGGAPVNEIPEVTPQPADPGDAAQAVESGAGASDEISEDEFEALLDQLHGKGKHGGVPQHEVAEEKQEAAGLKPASPAVERPTAQQPAAESEGQQQKSDAAPKRQPTGRPAKAGADKSAPRRAASAESTVRIDTAKLDDIMNMVGELVLVRNRLSTLKARTGDDEIANAIANLDVVTSNLQNAVMMTRMLPVKKVFGRFPRVVRDLARSLKKEIELVMSGEDTHLDKNLVEALADPMVHLIRNAVDHGVEAPDLREKIGKPRKGTLTLTAEQEGDHILLAISDDGRGMDPETLRRRAVDKGLMDKATAERLDDKECFNLIFHAGLSTKKEISDVSGRGVGMDVVKTCISQMNGSVDIESSLGQGTTITIRLPLTLAILPTLMIIVDGQTFALPLSSVVEILNPDLTEINVVDGQRMLLVRERALPLFYMKELLTGGAESEEDRDQGHVVIVNVGNMQAGLVVDGLIGQEEVVIKPLGAFLHDSEGMAGATITGDGKIALILDVPGLMQKQGR